MNFSAGDSNSPFNALLTRLIPEKLALTSEELVHLLTADSLSAASTSNDTETVGDSSVVLDGGQQQITAASATDAGDSSISPDSKPAA